MVEGTALEMRRTFTGSVSSNLTLSVVFSRFMPPKSSTPSPVLSAVRSPPSGRMPLPEETVEAATSAVDAFYESLQNAITANAVSGSAPPQQIAEFVQVGEALVQRLLLDAENHAFKAGLLASELFPSEAARPDAEATRELSESSQLAATEAKLLGALARLLKKDLLPLQMAQAPATVSVEVDPRGAFDD